MTQSSPKFRTIGITHTPFQGKLQAWLIQDGVMSGKGWKWRTVVSGTDASNDQDALMVAQDRYRAGQPSEEFEKSEAA